MGGKSAQGNNTTRRAGVLHMDAGTQAWVGNLRSSHFLVLEMFVMGTRTKRFGFFLHASVRNSSGFPIKKK